MENAATHKGAFIEFVAVAEWVHLACHGSEKATLLSRYFAQLSDDHLFHGVRYFTGQAFPLPDSPPGQVGEVTLISVLSILSGAEPAVLSARQRELGDWSEVAAQMLSRHKDPILTIDDVAIALEQLSKTKGRRKLSWVLRLLERATALEAKYLVKLLSGDLQIGLEEEAVEIAVAQMTEQPLQRIQWVHTLLGDLGKTALLARHDQLDQARMQLFRPVKFMLASAMQDPVAAIRQLPQGFAIEAKYDGLRVQAHIAPADRSIDLLQEPVFAGIRVALFSRMLQEVTTSFPELIVPLAVLEPHALVIGETAGLILDGEIVPYRDGRILPFAALEPRLDNQAPSEQLIAEVPVAFIAYDVLYKDGIVLINRPYIQRRRVLEALPIEAPKVRLANVQQLFDLEGLERQYLQARSQGQEGLMVKALDSLYRPGRRTKDWLKLRRIIATLDVVITAAEAEPEAVSPWFSHYAIAVRRSETDATLVNIGKVSLGLTEVEQETLSEWLRQHTIEEFANGKVCLVEPQIVLEITFERIGSSARQGGGYVLKEPQIVRIRHDKPAREIDTLDAVAHLAKLQANPQQNSRL